MLHLGYTQNMFVGSIYSWNQIVYIGHIFIWAQLYDQAWGGWISASLICVSCTHFRRCCLTILSCLKYILSIYSLFMPPNLQQPWPESLCYRVSGLSILFSLMPYLRTTLWEFLPNWHKRQLRLVDELITLRVCTDNACELQLVRLAEAYNCK